MTNAGMLRTLYMGGQTAGLVGLITAQQVCDVQSVVSVDFAVVELANRLGIPCAAFLRAPGVADAELDLLLCVHGREIVPESLLRRLVYGAINLHPCLWKFPGSDPIGRWLASDEMRISVGAHVMTAAIDMGRRICEAFVTVDRSTITDRASVYQLLYPVYGFVLRRALDKILIEYYGVWNPYGSTPIPPFVDDLEEGP